MSSRPLLTAYVRLQYLRTLHAVAHGAVVEDPSLGVLLADARMCAFPGRDGAPRSLGSVYGCFVTLFLGSSIRGVGNTVSNDWELRCLDNGFDPYAHGLTASCRGARLLKKDVFERHRVFEVNLDDGSTLAFEPFFNDECDLPWLASDGAIFIPHRHKSLVHIFSAALEYQGNIFTGEGSEPVAVCADDGIVAVCDFAKGCIYVYRRANGALLRTLGTLGQGPGELLRPTDVCFMADHRSIAVADFGNQRVSVLSVDGEFRRHVGADRLIVPVSLACSLFDELFVSSSDSVTIFLPDGLVLRTVANISGYLAIHGTRVHLLYSTGHVLDTYFHRYREIL
jgi:hypothetical protein